MSAEDPLDPEEPGRESDSPPANAAADAEESEPSAAALAIESAPIVARLAAASAWRTAGWTFDSYVRGMNWLTKAAVSDGGTAELLNDARAELREQARRLLGVDELEGRLFGARRPVQGEADQSPSDPLRSRGAELLERSADVELDDDRHPAYEGILGELAPDEARILRVLATEGAQASVDIRTWRPLGIGSTIVAPGLTMIGAEAGCRYMHRVPSYLNNLNRLGLIWFSREPLDDPLIYQVIEAQPDAVAAMKSAGRASTLRRSIHLTPFGTDFCETCLPLSTVEIEALEAKRAEAQPPPA